MTTTGITTKQDYVWASPGPKDSLDAMSFNPYSTPIGGNETKSC